MRNPCIPNSREGNRKADSIHEVKKHIKNSQYAVNIYIALQQDL